MREGDDKLLRDLIALTGSLINEKRLDEAVVLVAANEQIRALRYEVASLKQDIVRIKASFDD